MKLNAQGKIEWIFFDLDGTLADSISPLFNVYRSFLKEFQIPSDDRDLNQLNGLSLLEIVSFLKTKYKISQSEKALYDLYKSMVAKAYETEVTPMEDADNVIRSLRKSFKFQLVTSGDAMEANAFLKKQNWKELFDGCVFGQEVKRGKPDPEIYRLAVSRSGATVSSIVTLEDSVNGVKAATAVGITTIGFSNKTNADDLKMAGATMTINKLKELVNVLGSN